MCRWGDQRQRVLLWDKVLVVSIFLTVKQAMLAARQDLEMDDWFNMSSPAMCGASYPAKVHPRRFQRAGLTSNPCGAVGKGALVAVRSLA